MTRENTIIKRQEHYKELLIKQFKRVPIVQIACEKVGISRSTYYRWCKSDEKFREESEDAILKGKHLVNDMAESQLLNAIRGQNMTAIIFWLKHHHKDYQTHIKVSGKIKSETNPLTTEQEELIMKAIELSNYSLTNFQNESE